MKTIYIARRQVYPHHIINAGFFESYPEAMKCAQDSLYPEAATVEEFNSDNLLSAYSPYSSYPASICANKKTYYCFTNSLDQTFENRDYLRRVSTTRIPNQEIDDNWIYEKSLIKDADEFQLIVGLQSRIEDIFKYVLVIDECHIQEVECGILSEAFQRVVRGDGFKGRRELVDLAEAAGTVQLSAAGSCGPSDWDDNDAQKLAEVFWKNYVIGSSEPPEQDFYHWYNLFGFF